MKTTSNSKKHLCSQDLCQNIQHLDSPQTICGECLWTESLIIWCRQEYPHTLQWLNTEGDGWLNLTLRNMNSVLHQKKSWFRAGIHYLLKWRWGKAGLCKTIVPMTRVTSITNYIFTVWKKLIYSLKKLQVFSITAVKWDLCFTKADVYFLYTNRRSKWRNGNSWTISLWQLLWQMTVSA